MPFKLTTIIVRPFLILLIVVFVNGYTPSESVKSTHSITNTDVELSESYFSKAITLPIILFALGLFSLLFLNVALCSRYCSRRLQCGPGIILPQYTEDAWIDRIHRTGKKLFWLVFGLSILIIAVDQLVFIGSGHVDEGVRKTADATDFMNDIMINVDAESTLLLKHSSYLESLLNKSPCTSTTEVATFIFSFTDQVQDLSQNVDKVKKVVLDAKQIIDDYAMEYRTIGMYSVYVLAIFSAALFIISQYSLSEIAMKLTVAWGQFSYVLILLLCALWLLCSIFLADLCIDPDASVVRVVPEGIKNVTNYYSTCTGENPYLNRVDSASNSVLVMNESLNDLLSNECRGDGYLQLMADDVEGILGTLSDLSQLLICPPINAEYQDFVYKGLCDSFYGGFISIYCAHFVISFILFLLIIVGTIAYQYYDPRIEFTEREENVPNNLYSKDSYDGVNPNHLYPVIRTPSHAY